MKICNKSSCEAMSGTLTTHQQPFTTPTALSLRLKQDVMNLRGRYFQHPRLSTQLFRKSKVKFTQDTPVQYLHKTTITLQQNTIDRRSNSPSLTLAQLSYLHLPAKHFDAIIFLQSRWFSKTLKHHPTCAITRVIRQQRNISPPHT